MAERREGLGVALAVSSSGFIGASFIVKKKGLRVSRPPPALPAPPPVTAPRGLGC